MACCSSGNELETHGIRSVFLPRYCPRAEEVWTAGLEHQGELISLMFCSVDQTTSRPCIDLPCYDALEIVRVIIIIRQNSFSASDSAFSYTFLRSVCLSVCLLHSCTLLKRFDGFRCHLTGTVAGSNDTLC